jgi:hypothetical protein
MNFTFLEFAMMAVGVVFWLLYVAAVIWVLLTLYRLRTASDTILRRLDSLERLLQRSSLP